MKWTTLVGSGVFGLAMALPMVNAEGADALQEQARSMEQSRQRLEQRFQSHDHAGAGMQYRYEQHLRHRHGGSDGKQSRYEVQERQGGGPRR